MNISKEAYERYLNSKNGVVVGKELTIKPSTTGISKEAYSNYLLKNSQANYDSAVGFADKAYAGWTDAQTMASAVTAWDRLAADIEKLSTFDDTYAEDAQNFRKVAEQMKELQAIYRNYNSADELKTGIEQAQAQKNMLAEIKTFDMNAARRELEGLKKIARESENYTHVKSTHKNPRNYWIGQQTYEFFGDGREIETYEELLKAIDAREQKLQDMKLNKEALEGYKLAATIDGVTEDFAAKLPNNEDMTKAERETYNKLSRLVNSNAAKEFWNAIEEGVNIRKGVADYERLKDTKVGKYFYSVKAGLDSFAQGIKNHFSPYDTYYAPTSTSVTSSLLRQDMGKVGGALYDIGLNVTRMAPSILISRVLPALGASQTVAAIGGLLPMGTSVHGEAYAQMINEGYTHGQASLYADLMALSETSLTYLLSGMGNLGMQALPNSAMNKIIQGVDNGLFAFAITNAGEAIEEGLQPIIEMVVKGAITGDYENLDVGEVLYSALMGWATSAVMEGTSSAISKGVSKFTKPTPTVNGMIHTAMTEQLLNLAKDAPQYSTSRIMAEKLTDNSWQGSYDIAKYLGYRGKGLTADSTQKLTRSLIERGIDSSSARTIAENVSNVSNGKTLSEKKQDALNKNGVVTSAMVDYVIQEDMVNNEKLTKGYEAIEQGIKNNAKRMTQPVTVQNGTQATETVQKPTEAPKTEQTPVQNTEPVKTPSKTVDESAFNQSTKSQLNKLSKALGMNIRVFSQDAVGRYIRNGYIDESTNTIYLNDKSKNPVAVVLKHELTHSTENVPDYALFSESVFTSQAFKKWLNGKSFADYRTEYIKDRQKAKDENFAKSIDADELANRADQEILADFVSEALFTKNGLTDLINTLEGKSRTGFIEWVLNCIRSVINKIKGIDTTLENELRALEKEYASLLNRSTKNKKSTGEGVKYDISENFYQQLNDWQDGLILDEGGTGGYGEEVKSRGLSYVVFSPEQVKRTDNTKPTSDSDIRYSISPEQSEQLDQLLYDGEITPEEARKIRASKNPIAEIKKIIDLSEKDVDTDVKGAKQKRAKLRKFFEDLKKTAKMAEKEIKDSKFFDSIKSAEWLDDDFKEEASKEEYLKHYVGITNQETLDEAATKLNNEGRKAVLEWQSKKASHANAVDVAMGFILLERAKQKGDIDAQVFIADKLREIGTTSGQTVQAFSILGRMTPEGMLKYAQHELSKALEIMQEYQTQRWIDKYSEQFALTPEEAELITRKTRAAAKLPTDSRQQQILLAEIAAIIQDKIPSKSGTGIKAVQRVAMLLNPKTHIRNIMGNVGSTPLFQFGDLFGGIADAMVTKAVRKKGFKAKRTTAPINISFKTDMQSLARGFAEAFDDYKRGISTRNMTESRYGVTGDKALNENTKSAAYNAVARAFNKVDAFNSFLLEMGDRPFYEMWFTRSLNAQMKLNKVSKPTQAMIDIAVQEALARTWQDNNAWTKSVSAIKDGLNSIPLINPSSINKSWADYGLGDMLIKFTKTPANLTKALVDFSPLGAANIIRDLSKFTNELGKGKYDPKLQKALVDSIGKTLAGTLTYVMLTSLMHMGAIVLTGANDEDKDVRAFENYIMGMPEYSIKVGDTYITYDWAQPVGGIMAIVADYMKAKDEGKSTVENLLEGVKGGSDIILRQSFMKALQEFFGTEGSFADKLMSAAFSEPSVYVPQILSQFAELTDDSRRVTYTGNAFETAWNKVKNKIPGLRQTLEKDVNVMGETAENPRNDIWNAFFAPGNVYSKSESEAISEIYRVYKSTGEKSVIPPKADSYITVKGVKHTFTAEEKTQIQREMGTIAAQIIDDVMDDKRYDNLSDQQKVTLFGNIYKYAKAKAKASISYDYEMLHAMYGDSLTKAKYDSFSKKQRKMLAEEYYLDSYSKLKNGEEADYFLEKMDSSNKKTSNSSEKTIANVEKNK